MALLYSTALLGHLAYYLVFLPLKRSLFLLTELYDVCELLQGEFGSLKSGLTSRSIESKASDYLVTDLSSGEASSYRDVLCKTLYGRLFTWMVNRINETIKVRYFIKQSLSVL